MKHTTVLQFGKHHHSSTDTAEKIKKEVPSRSADLTLVFGAVVAAVFFISSLTGSSLNGDAMRVESVLNDKAVPVMSTGIEDAEEIREILRENVRDASGEAFGYMGGKWTLWEYLGDIMAEMLIGE